MRNVRSAAAADCVGIGTRASEAAPTAPAIDNSTVQNVFIVADSAFLPVCADDAPQLVEEVENQLDAALLHVAIRVPERCEREPVAIWVQVEFPPDNRRR